MQKTYAVKYTSEQREVLLKAFVVAERNTQANFGEHFVKLSIDEFQRLGFSYERALYKVCNVHLKKIFGNLKFNDFIDDEESVIDYDEVNRLAKNMFESWIKVYKEEQEKIKLLSSECDSKESEAKEIISNQSKLQDLLKSEREATKEKCLEIIYTEKNPFSQRQLIKKL